MTRYKAVFVPHYGGVNVMEIREVPLPEPRPDEVRVKVLRAGVALGDIQLRKGVSPQALIVKRPFVPGFDIVGIVEAMGSDVTSLAVGQTVAVFTGTGGYSEFVCVPAKEAIPVPENIDPAAAVSVVLNYTTAYQMLHRVAKVQPGQHVLIHNAAGGVGSALMQLGQIANLEMIGTASQAKLPLVTELGGTPINYKTEDVIKRTRQLTQGQGVDAVFEGLGYRWWDSYKLLRRGGHFVGYGVGAFTNNPWQRIPNLITRLSTLGLMRLRADGRRASFYSIFAAKPRHPDWFHGDVATLFNLLATQQIKPIVAEQIPLEKAAEAHTLLESGQVRGKIVLMCA